MPRDLTATDAPQPPQSDVFSNVRAVKRPILAGLLVGALVLAGCGGESTAENSLGAIKVSQAATPKVEGAKGATSATTEAKLVEEGGGDTLAKGDTVKLNYLAINARTGKEFDSTYASGNPGVFTLGPDTVLPGFSKSLIGEKVGSRVAAVVPPTDAFNEARPQLGLRKADTIVFVFDIVTKVADSAVGKSRKLPGDLPRLELGDDGAPRKFVATSQTAKVQRTAQAEVLIRGKGDKIKLDQTVVVQYHGQIYPDGKVFDTSWGKQPASFALSKGQLIECWTDLLPGQRIGSRVALVCPANVAYGKEGQGPDIKPGDTLVFAIDILDAS